MWPVHASLAKPLGFFDRFRRTLPVNIRYGQPADDATQEAVAMLEQLVDGDQTDLYNQFVSHTELKGLLRSARNPPELISIARYLGADVGLEG